MRARLNTYAGYTIGCAIVWAIILATAAAAGNQDAEEKLRRVFGGWVIGWTSATIARYVYPPPKHRRRFHNE